MTWTLFSSTLPVVESALQIGGSGLPCSRNSSFYVYSSYGNKDSFSVSVLTVRILVLDRVGIPISFHLLFTHRSSQNHGRGCVSVYLQNRCPVVRCRHSPRTAFARRTDGPTLCVLCFFFTTAHTLFCTCSHARGSTLSRPDQRPRARGSQEKERSIDYMRGVRPQRARLSARPYRDRDRAGGGDVGDTRGLARSGKALGK